MNKSQLEKILKLRDRIDQVDSRILKLIQQRAAFAKSIGTLNQRILITNLFTGRIEKQKL